MSDRVGQRFGNYQLRRQIGQGGFAEVYLGEHIYLKTQAAVKIIFTHLGNNDLHEFLAEAQTVANLKHPHIVQVLEFDIQDGQPFLVMNYAHNGTVRQHYPPDTRPDNEHIASFVTQVAAALQYAHDHKVVHRDVKPENMLLAADDNIVLSDFGIAVISQSSRYHSDQAIGGTVAYMAPEQLQGHAVPASDQYALGIIVYEWLCGERPFKGNFAEIGSQHLFAPPPSLREKRPSISIAVEEVVFTALAKDPTQRFANVTAFANALVNALNDQPTIQADFATPTQAKERPPFQYNQPSQTVPVGQSPQSPPIAPTVLPYQPGQQPSFSQQPPSGQSGYGPGYSSGTSTNMFAPNVATTPLQKKQSNNVFRLVIVGLLALVVVALLLNVLLPRVTSSSTSNNNSGSSVTSNNNPAKNSQATATPTPTPTPTPVARGTQLYQANWSQDADGWKGASSWKAFGNGQVGSDGTDQQSFFYWAPAHLPSKNYAVEARVQFVRSNYPGAGTTYGTDEYEFGVVVRGDGVNNGYEIGIGQCSSTIMPGDLFNRPNGALAMRVDKDNQRSYFDGLTTTPNVLKDKDVPTDTSWHIYRVEVSGNEIKFFIDGTMLIDTTDNAYTDGTNVGLRSAYAIINVSSFKVIAL